MNCESQCAPTLCESPWNAYLTEQAFADNKSINSHAFGHDEMLGEIINRIEEDTCISDGSLSRISRNRARKFRNQRRILDERIACFDAVAEAGTAAHDAAVLREEIEWVQRNTNDLEWHCLWALAMGYSYDEIAKRVTRTATTLRSIVSRCRTRLFELATAA